jgi:hypothetical protein
VPGPQSPRSQLISSISAEGASCRIVFRL